MPTRTEKEKSYSELSNDELLELQSGFIDLRSHADHNIREIFKVMKVRLEENLIK